MADFKAEIPAQVEWLDDDGNPTEREQATRALVTAGEGDKRTRTWVKLDKAKEVGD